jgi:hypothetical protein
VTIATHSEADFNLQFTKVSLFFALQGQQLIDVLLW